MRLYYFTFLDFSVYNIDPRARKGVRRIYASTHRHVYHMYLLRYAHTTADTYIYGEKRGFFPTISPFRAYSYAYSLAVSRVSSLTLSRHFARQNSRNFFDHLLFSQPLVPFLAPLNAISSSSSESAWHIVYIHTNTERERARETLSGKSRLLKRCESPCSRAGARACATLKR